MQLGHRSTTQFSELGHRSLSKMLSKQSRKPAWHNVITLWQKAKVYKTLQKASKRVQKHSILMRAMRDIENKTF